MAKQFKYSELTNNHNILWGESESENLAVNEAKHQVKSDLDGNVVA